MDDRLKGRVIDTNRTTPDARDAEWVQRELGDVPRRNPCEALADAGFPALGALVGMLRMRD